MLFSTYEVEWSPDTKEVLMVGVFDGDVYRSYPTIRDFVRGEFHHRNGGRRYYARVGGIFDAQFIIEDLVRLNQKHERPWFKFEIKVHDESGILEVRIENLVDGDFFYLSDGRVSGLDLQSFSRWSYRQTDVSRYNEADCRALWKVLSGPR